MKSSILGVSLLYGRFKAISVKKKEVKDTWECPYPVGDIESLKRALVEAVGATSFGGKYVSFVFEDALCEHQLVGTPPMKRRDLKRYVSRKANQLKTFEGDAAISYSVAPSPKGGSAVLINILPKSFIKDLMAACRELDLFPVQLTPLSAAMGLQFKRLPIDQDEIVMLVTEASKKLVLAVGKLDGSVLMDRYLVYERDAPMDINWLGREIQRSALFSKQQFGVGVRRVLMLGDFSDDIVKNLGDHVDIPIEKSGIVVDPFFWVNQSLTLSARKESNFITPDLQRLAVRNRMLKVAVAAVVFLWVGALATAGIIELQIYNEKRAIKLLGPRYSVIAAEKKTWDKRFDEYDKWRLGTQAIRTARNAPPVAGWFMGYLGDALPSDLVLTQMLVEKEGGGWNVKLTGQALKSSAQSAVKLRGFEERLERGPYKVRIVKSWREQWVDLLRRGTGVSRSVQEFSLKGRIQ